jgi:hypothetical protein
VGKSGADLSKAAHPVKKNLDEKKISPNPWIIRVLNTPKELPARSARRIVMRFHRNKSVTALARRGCLGPH